MNEQELYKKIIAMRLDAHNRYIRTSLSGEATRARVERDTLDMVLDIVAELKEQEKPVEEVEKEHGYRK